MEAEAPAQIPAVKQQAAGLMPDEHFTVDGTLIEAWASQKSFQRKGTDDGAPDADRNFHGVPLEGNRKPEPFVASKFQETQGQFSPDGKWMAYVSNESGRFEVYVEPFPRGAGAAGKWAVSTAGGEEPLWRPDGKELFYFDPGGRMFAVPVQNSGPKSASLWVRRQRYSTRASRGMTVVRVFPRP